MEEEVWDDFFEDEDFKLDVEALGEGESQLELELDFGDGDTATPRSKEATEKEEEKEGGDDDWGDDFDFGSDDEIGIDPTTDTISSSPKLSAESSSSSTSQQQQQKTSSATEPSPSTPKTAETTTTKKEPPKRWSLPPQYCFFQNVEERKKVSLPPPTHLWSVHPYHSSEAKGTGWERAIQYFKEPEELEQWLEALSSKTAFYLKPIAVGCPLPILQQMVIPLRKLEKSLPQSQVVWAGECMRVCSSLFWAHRLQVETRAPSSVVLRRHKADVSRLLFSELVRFFEMIATLDSLDRSLHETISLQILSIGLSFLNTENLSFDLSSSSSPLSPSLSSSPIHPHSLPSSAVGGSTPHRGEQQQQQQQQPGDNKNPQVYLQEICQAFYDQMGNLGEMWEISVQFHRGLIDTPTTVSRLADCFRGIAIPCTKNRPLHTLFCQLAHERNRSLPPDEENIEALRRALSPSEVLDMSWIISSLYLCIKGFSPIDLNKVTSNIAGGHDDVTEATDDDLSFVEFSIVSMALGEEDESEGEEDAFEEIEKEERVKEKVFGRGEGGGREGSLVSLPRQQSIAEELFHLLEKTNGDAERLCGALMFTLYPLIPLDSALKSRVAYILGDYAQKAIHIRYFFLFFFLYFFPFLSFFLKFFFKNSPPLIFQIYFFRLAEKLFFEAIFVLDMLPPICGPPLLVSSLGLMSLFRYSEVLTQLDKVFFFFFLILKK